MRRGDSATLTILFSDVCRSTEIFEQLGDVEARTFIGRALDDMARIVEHTGGKVIKSLGDELMCTFPAVAQAAAAAIAMQRKLPRQLPGEAGMLQFRIGFHSGEVLQEQGDVFGDAVNVAARLASNAKAGQVLLSSSSLIAEDQLATRSLGQIALKGRQQPVDISELLWQADDSQLTAVASAVSDTDIAAARTLSLRYQSVERNMDGRSFPVTIGRDPHNDLIIDQSLVSRHHATIEVRPGYFYLIDRSTNGTVVVSEDEQLDVHRSELPLRGQGTIHLGNVSAEPISYRVG